LSFWGDLHSLVAQSGTNNQWVYKSINLDNYAGEIFNIRFQQSKKTNPTGKLLIDYLRIFDPTITSVEKLRELRKELPFTPTPVPVNSPCRLMRNI
jgi:hypothetical protein